MSWSLTRTPCFTSNPACCAREQFERMPVAITTNSAGIVLPSSSNTPRTCPAPTISRVTALLRRVIPMRPTCARGSLRRVGSVVAVEANRGPPRASPGPRRARAPAASRPSSPPPMQTQRAPASQAFKRASASWTVRRPVTPWRSAPGMGGIKGRAPAASRSLSKGRRRPSPSWTAWSARCRAETSVPCRSWICCS